MKANVRFKFAWLGSIVLLALVGAPIALAKSPKYIRVQVRFLATSTSTRSSFGDNYDIYLIEVNRSNGAGPELARLEDVYPSYQSALPEAALRPHDWTLLKLIRDQSCDIAFGAMPLRTAPGDPSAILLERLGFRPQLTKLPSADEVLPCFRTVR